MKLIHIYFRFSFARFLKGFFSFSVEDIMQGFWRLYSSDLILGRQTNGFDIEKMCWCQKQCLSSLSKCTGKIQKKTMLKQYKHINKKFLTKKKITSRYCFLAHSISVLAYFTPDGGF